MQSHPEVSVSTTSFDGTTVTYTAAGRGSAVMLVHGVGGDADALWTPVLDAFSPTRTVLAPHLSGTAGTVDPGGPITVRALAEQVLAVADDAGVDAFDVVAYSFGTPVALTVAAAAPERAKSLTLIAPWVRSDPQQRVLFDLLARLFRANRELAARLATLTAFAPSFYDDPDRVEQTVAAFTAILAPGTDRQAEAAARLDVLDRVAAVRAPARIIGLTHDRQVPIVHARDLAAALGADFREEPTGHALPWERPDRFLAVIEESLTDLSAPDRDAGTAPSTDAATTRAAVIHRFGDVNVVTTERIALAAPGARQVRLRVEAAAINPVDLGTRAGRTVPAADARFPMILGWDAAGVIEAVGPDVDGWSPGQRVIAMSPQPANQVGTHAEHIVLDADLLAPYPGDVPAEIAATLPLAGTTARMAVEALAAQSGDVVVVNGAAGAVGGFATQLLARAGVRVLASVRPTDAEYVRTLGAEAVLDPTRDLVEQTLERVGQRAAGALDTVGGDAARATFAAVRDGGRYVTTNPPWWKPGGVFDPERGIVPHIVSVEPNPDYLRELSDLMARGELVARVARTIPLEQAAAAHAALEHGTPGGKVVLVPAT